MKMYRREFVELLGASMGALLLDQIAGGAWPELFFQEQDGIRDATVTGVQTCALPIYALNFSAALQHVGDRVELIGRIVEIKPGSRKRGKGEAKRYIFINFGSWRGNIVKISIWSDGLAKLKEQPSKAWIGRWVSVTGLMDVPYESKRYGHKHL